MIQRVLKHPLFNILITLGILAGLLFVLYTKGEDLQKLLTEVPNLSSSHFLLLSFCLALSLVNWALETFKWQVLSKPLQKINFSSALKATLAGLGSGMLAPKSVGDIFGRLLFSDYVKKERLVGAILLSRITQMAFAFSAGILGLMYLVKNSSSPFPFLNEIQENTVVSVLIGLFLLAFILFILKTNWGKSLFKKYLIVLRLYSYPEILKISYLAGTRYLVFLLQFYLAFVGFGAISSIPTILAASALVLFLRSTIISFNIFADLGVRQLGALLIFGFIGETEIIILCATLYIWLVNIVFPSLVGTFFIATRKTQKA